MSKAEPPDPSDDRVPLFGTWRAIYAAVAISALVVMALLALFSRWPF
jgi:anti-sigma-K factor RskA